MSAADFEVIAGKIKPFTDYIYLHVMGEPTLNPDFIRILEIAERYGFRVCLTTNGTLLNRQMLESMALYKLSVSLHSFEGNAGTDPGAKSGTDIERSSGTELGAKSVTGLDGKQGTALSSYLERVYSACSSFSGIVAYRLWNEGGDNSLNEKIIAFLSEKYGTDINSIPEKNGSKKITDNVFLENAARFEWPSLAAGEKCVSYCHALTQQLAILVDGTVVPCCLDSDGTIKLGNIFREELSDILETERVGAFLKGMRNHRPSEELCRHCGYATRFKK